MDNVHAEYNLQTLLYVARLASAEDYATALSLGLRPDQVDRIRNLSLEALHELALGMNGRIMTVCFDPDALNTAFRILQRRAEERRLCMDMIVAGASFSVMNELFGLNKSAYSGYRKLLGLSDLGIGRTEKPSEAQQKAIWRAWLESDALTDLRDRLMAVHRATRAEIRAIWALLKEWEATGLTPILDEASSMNGRDKPFASEGRDG